MIITGNSPEVVVLSRVWNSAEGRTEKLGEELRQRLLNEVLAPAVGDNVGELILKYHEFLMRVPNGNHSFAHGSEMETKTVYWVSAARIAHSKIEEIPWRRNHLESGKWKISFPTQSKLLVPVHWETHLEPRYRRNARQSYFRFGMPVEGNEGKIDVSLLGHHLFRQKRGDLDFATKIEIVIGNESVGIWLRERKSAQTFNMLMRR